MPRLGLSRLTDAPGRLNRQGDSDASHELRAGIKTPLPGTQRPCRAGAFLLRPWAKALWKSESLDAALATPKTPSDKSTQDADIRLRYRTLRSTCQPNRIGSGQSLSTFGDIMRNPKRITVPNSCPADSADPTQHRPWPAATTSTRSGT